MGMKVYKKEEVDEIFSSWPNDLKQLDVIEAIPKANYEARLKENNELINDLEELRTMINKFAESYETRLKADMVAMLEELKSEMNPIKECEQQIYGKESWNFVGKCQDVIQQKINALKENTNGME